jgi:tetratricopeptide (TPR) repeat protein
VSPKEEYSRADVRRKFGLSERQLRSWERQRLIAASATYTFSDLIAFQTLIKLRENKISSKEIYRALESLREKLGWVKQPLSELRVVSDGGRIAVQLSGQKMEAISGQILFDFDASELGGIKSFPARKPKIDRTHESEAWFQKGLELEESGAPVEDAVDAYRKVLDLNPGAAGALVNLGTIYYRLRKFDEAEKYYLAAIEADP